MKEIREGFKKGLIIVSLCVIYLAFDYEILGSETLQITTYYPAPYGGYARLLTTDMTLLARDSGNVGIGMPNPQKKLDVNGSTRLGGRIGTQWFDPDGGYPWGWGGGVHTWDVFAEASILARQVCIGDKWNHTCRNTWPTCYNQYYGYNNVWCASGYKAVGFLPASCGDWMASGSLWGRTFIFLTGSVGMCGYLVCCTGL